MDPQIISGIDYKKLYGFQTHTPLENLLESGQVQKRATMPQCGLTTPGSRAGRRKLTAFLDKTPTAVKNLAGITEIWIPP